MSMTRFRERMVGRVGPVDRLPWTVQPRGLRAGDGIVRTAATTGGARPAVLDLDDLHVVVHGLDPVTDGWRATLTAGTVRGIAAVPVPVDCGSADILTTAVEGRRMHYRLLVVHGSHRYVVEGLKTVRGGLRRAWASTTTLHTVVVRLDPETTMPTEPEARARWLDAGGVDGQVVCAGVLRVRGVLAQGLSMRGPVVPFLLGFVRRSVRP
ncbi:hypothetical protein ACLBWP_11235 [Microbacterium sp. M1A1_1b]